jgi:hypothetical protein
LRRAGFCRGGTHVATRQFVAFPQVYNFLKRAAGEAKVEGLLLIADDSAHGAVWICWDWALNATGIRHVAFVGYLASHPWIVRHDLDSQVRFDSKTPPEHLTGHSIQP